MKFPAFALLACSFLVQSTAAYQPSLRLSATDEVESCFKSCGKKADKASKVEECQAGCVDTAVASGRSRSSVGTNGADDLLSCGSGCASSAENKYKKEAKDFDSSCKKSCPDKEEDGGACEKDCKSQEKAAEKSAETAAKSDYEKCNKGCFKGDSIFTVFKSYLQTSEDTLGKCIEGCSKKLDKSEDTIECQNECYAEYPSATRSASTTTCTSTCATEAEDTYDKEEKHYKCECEDGVDGCDCKKEAEEEAEKKAESEYKKCSKGCFETGSVFTVFKSYLQTSEDTLEKCIEGCDKKIDKSEDTIECQNDCYAEYPSATRSASTNTCTSTCATEAEDTYDKEEKHYKCECEDGVDGCDCKKEAEKEAEKKAESEYKKCSKGCFETESYFKIGYVA